MSTNEPPVGATEEERAAEAACIVEILTDLMTGGRLGDALELTRACERAYAREAPDDVVTRLEITSVGMFALHMSGDHQAAERAGLLLRDELVALIWRLESAVAATRTFPVSGTSDVVAYLDHEHVAAVGRALCDVDAGPDDPAAWRLVRARRAAGTVENNLGVTYLTVGDPRASRDHLRCALALRADRPEDRYLLSQTLSNIGDVELADGRAPEAVAALRESIEIAESIPDATNFPGFIAALHVHARALLAVGDEAAGEAQLRRAADAARSQVPASARTVGVADLYLSSHLLGCGCLGEAFVLASQAATLLAAGPDTDHTFLAAAGFTVAMFLWARGDAAAAAEQLDRVTFLKDAALFHELQLGDEETRLERARASRATLDVLLSIAHDDRSEDLAKVAFGAATRRKALGAEIHLQHGVAQRSHAVPLIDQARAEADALRARIADTFVSGGTHDDVLELVAELKSKEQLLGFAERLSRDTRATAQTGPGGPTADSSSAYETWFGRWLGAPDSIGAELPPHSVIIEYFRFTLVGPPPWNDGSGDAHYCAFVLRAGAERARFVPLGRAEDIESAVTEFRLDLEAAGDALAEGGDAGFAGSRTELLAEAVRVATIDPVLRVTDEDIRTLLISPDGEIASVPFAILPLDGGHLLDRYHVAYVDSSRDLLRDAAAGTASSPALVLADPDVAAGAEPLLDDEAEGFGSLPGAREEGVEVAELLGVEPLLGAAATKDALRKARQPIILHIASHGWFLPTAPDGEDPTSSAFPRLRALSGAGGVRAWGARSGLVLAGFNAAWQGRETSWEMGTGLFTSDEVAQLELTETELVVLSACDTALGRPIALEGVFGLRRAFVQAGARSVLSTMWQVPDEPGRVFATAFYRHLLDGAPRATAVGQAQMEVRKTFPHPYAWGAFVVHGEPGPLGPSVLERFALDADVRARTRRARAADAHRRGDVDDAVALLEESPTGRTDLASATLRGIFLDDAGRSGDALPVLSPAADEGYVPAMQALAQSLHRSGDAESARRWYQRAFDAGEDGAAQNLAVILLSSGDRDAARRVWRAAAERGDVDSLYATGNEEYLADHPQDAEAWWTRAADGGDPRAAVALAHLANDRGDEQGRAAWWLRAAELGDGEAALHLGEQAYADGRPAVAKDLWQAAAQRGNMTCAHNLGIVLQDLGLAGSDGWWSRAGASGVTGSANRLAGLLESRGDLDGAALWWERAARDGHDTAGISLGIHLCGRGRLDEAERRLRPAAEAGQRDAANGLAQVLQMRGLPDEAAHWRRRAAQAGQPDAALALARDALERGDAEAAQPLLTVALEAGIAEAFTLAGDWVFTAGQEDEALRWWTSAAGAGNETGALRAAACLRRRGDAAGAIDVLQPALRPTAHQARRVDRLLRLDPAELRRLAGENHVHALLDLATLAEMDGDPEETLGHLTAAATAGEADAFVPAAGAALALDRTEVAIGWLRQAADRGSIEAAHHLRGLSERRGDQAEAERWAERARVIGQARERIVSATDVTLSADDVESRLRSAAGSGVAEATMRLAAVLTQLESPDAEEWVTRAAGLGDYVRPNERGTWLRDRGRVDESDRWWALARALAQGR